MTILENVSRRYEELARPNLGYRAFHAPLNVLSTLGHILDTPGAAIRGLLAGLADPEDANPLDYLAGLLYDPKRRVSGEELLGGKRDKFSWRGLAAEIALDPLTYLSLGASTIAGKAASRAGKASELLARAEKLDPAIKKLAKIENTLPKHYQPSAIKSVLSELKNPKALELYQDGKQILSQVGDVKPLASTLKEQGELGQRALISWQPMFSKTSVPLITAPEFLAKFQPVADAGSKLNKFLRNKSTLFTTRTGIKDLDYLIENYLGANRLGTQQSSTIAKEMLREGKQVAQQLDMPITKLFEHIRNYLEQDPDAVLPDISRISKTVSKSRELVKKAKDKAINEARLEKNVNMAFQGLDYLLAKQMQEAIKVRLLAEEVPGFAHKRLAKNVARVEELTQRLLENSKDWRDFPELVTQRSADQKEIKALLKKIKSDKAIPTARYKKAVEALDDTTDLIKGQIPEWRRYAKKYDNFLTRDRGLGVTAAETLGRRQVRLDKLEKSLTNLIQRKQGFQIFRENAARDFGDVFVKFADKNEEYFAKLFREAQEHGVTFAPNKSGLGYVMHKITAEGYKMIQETDVQDWLQDNIRQKMNLKVGQSSITKSRVSKGTIDKINQEFRKKYNVDFNLMETDHIKLLQSYTKNIAREKKRVDLIRDLIHLRAVPKDTSEQKLRSVTNLLAGERIGKFESFDLTTEEGLAALKRSEWANMGVPEQEITQLMKLIKAIDEPIAGKGFVKGLDVINTAFRRGFLGFWPGSNIRDFVNGAVYNLLDDIDPKVYKEAVRDVDKLMHNLDDPFVQRLYTDGVFGESLAMEARMGAEGLENISSKPGLVRKFFQVSDKPLGTHKLPIGVEARQYYDNINRYALYKDKINKGLSHSEAVQHVKKWHFNYDDLSLAERKYLRRSFLFYSFVRKNTPLILSLIFSNPRIPLTYARLTGKTNANLNRPDWMQDMIQFGDNYLSYNLSFEDYDLLAPDNRGYERSLEKAAGRLSPAFSIPLQLMSGKQFYSGRNIQGGMPNFLLKSSPVGRHVGAVQQIDERPVNTLMRFITGANVQRHKEADLKLSSEKEQLQQALERSYRAGDSTKFDVYSSNDERVKMLISELQKRRQQTANR